MAVNERPWELANAVLDAVVDHYEANDLALPARRYVNTGLIAYDCDQLVVSLIRAYSVNRLVGAAVEVVDTENCLHWRGVQLTVELLRCAPTGDGVDRNGNARPPTVAQIEASARTVSRDGVLLTDAIRNAWKADAFGVGPVLAFEAWEALGPEGGLVGGRLTLRLGLS